MWSFAWNFLYLAAAFAPVPLGNPWKASVHRSLSNLPLISLREQYILKFQAPIYHGVLYVIFAGVLGISFASTISLLVVPFILLTLAAIAYFFAWFAAEDATIRSSLTFGNGLPPTTNPSPNTGTGIGDGKETQTMSAMEAGTL